MKFALSTNWCNRRMKSGEEIADKAMELGFEELELGFHTTQLQVKGFKARLDRIPVGSIHAFCPVPISAPQGYPELYSLASPDEEDRKMAQIHVKRNVAFAAEMGADTVVLHAGRVMCRGLFSRWGWDLRRRVKRGRKMIDIFRRELDLLVPELEKNKVTLGLENLPYLEGFPAEWELKDVVGEWVRPWLDTGHDLVRRINHWPADVAERFGLALRLSDLAPVGLHINDSQGGDDHLPPGTGRVDFAELRVCATQARHLVFEPAADIEETELKEGLEYLKGVWAI